MNDNKDKACQNLQDAAKAVFDGSLQPLNGYIFFKRTENQLSMFLSQKARKRTNQNYSEIFLASDIGRNPEV